MDSQAEAEALRSAQEEHRRFQFALGNLTLSWATTESALYSVLKYYAQVSDGVGRALFSGTRASDLMGFIKAIAHNTEMNALRRADLDYVFPQISAIQTMRNMLVHHVNGAEQVYDPEDPSRRELTDRVRASRYGNEKTYRIGSATIEAMNGDLLTCCWRLVAHPDNTNEPFEPGRNPEGKLAAWLYKSPQPEIPNQHSS